MCCKKYTKCGFWKYDSSLNPPRYLCMRDSCIVEDINNMLGDKNAF